MFVLKLMQHLLLETILWNDFSYWTRNTTSLKMGETHSNKYLPCTHQEKEFIGRNKWNKGEAGCRVAIASAQCYFTMIKDCRALRINIWRFVAVGNVNI